MIESAAKKKISPMALIRTGQASVSGKAAKSAREFVEVIDKLSKKSKSVSLVLIPLKGRARAHWPASFRAQGASVKDLIEALLESVNFEPAFKEDWLTRKENIMELVSIRSCPPLALRAAFCG